MGTGRATNAEKAMISEAAALHKFAAEQARLQAAMEELAANDGDDRPMPEVHRKLMAALRLRRDLKRAWSYDGRETTPLVRERRGIVSRFQQLWRTFMARVVPPARSWSIRGDPAQRPWSPFFKCISSVRLRSRRVVPLVHDTRHFSPLAVTLTAPSFAVS